MGSCSSHQAFAHAPMPFSLQATPAGVTSSWQSLRLGDAPRPSPHGPGQAPGYCALAVPRCAGALPALPLNPNQLSDHEAGRAKLNSVGPNKLGRRGCECRRDPGAREGQRRRSTKSAETKVPPGAQKARSKGARPYLCSAARGAGRLGHCSLAATRTPAWVGPRPAPPTALPTAPPTAPPIRASPRPSTPRHAPGFTHSVGNEGPG